MTFSVINPLSQCSGKILFSTFDMLALNKYSLRKVNTMSKAHPPELKKLMDKRLTLKLNANRQVFIYYMF